MIGETAILVFTRRSSKEVEHKQFLKHSSRRKNRIVANTLIKQSIIVASQTSAQVFVIDDTQQVGCSFGEKLGNAFQSVFDKGFQKVIAIGNDCPELTAQLLEKTILELQTKDFVIGPSKDHGMYLIGIDRASFHLEEFSHLLWQTSDTFSGFMTYVNRQNKSVHLLRSLIDIDNYQDLLIYLKTGSIVLFLKKILENLVDAFSKWQVDYFYPFYANPIYKIDLKRGPPLVITQR